MKLNELLPWIQSWPVDRVVLSGNGSSMIPTIVKGDRITVLLKDRSLTPGEIYLCRDENENYSIHRLLSAAPAIITKGDNCLQPDPPVAEVLGRVERIDRTLLSRLRRLKLKLWSSIEL